MKKQLKILSHSLTVGIFIITGCFVPGLAAADAGEVNVYSARKEALILPLLERFEQQHNVKVNLVTGKADGLLKRIQLEGAATPADVFITVDAGRLHRAKEAEVFMQLNSDAVNTAVPEHLRDADGYWTALSKRARTIIYAKDRVDAGKLSTYEALVDPHWKGRVCIRSSGNIYNQSLVSSMIEAIGESETQKWATAFVPNFARPPTGGDTDQIKAVAAGQCDLAIANTYYFGRLSASEKSEDRELASRVKVFWPNQSDRGTHINVSGAGIIKHTKNLDNAVALIEFLLEPQSQQWYAAVNHEYPVVPGTEISEILKSFGDFKSDDLNLSKLGVNNRKAVKVMDRAGWK
ncbi:MAG: Fe(3+) ABC transporter substrate-binding protein [Acidiferrobacterales bacterium]|nr:Fe(3+) ABC transporter substrate-binding protein [Acidiferrobacterales bacterium]